MTPELIQEINNEAKKKIKKLIKSDESEETNLISLLQEVQEHYGYLPSKIIFNISEELKIPPALIYGIATFYTQFKLQAKGENVLTCCEGTACHIKESSLLLTFLENILGIESGETTEDKRFSLESVACLGCCAISPVCIINGQIYGNLTLKKMKNLLNKLMKEKTPKGQ